MQQQVTAALVPARRWYRSHHLPAAVSISVPNSFTTRFQPQRPYQMQVHRRHERQSTIRSGICLLITATHLTNDISGNVITVNHRYTTLQQEVADCALATSDAACQTDNLHVSTQITHQRLTDAIS